MEVGIPHRISAWRSLCSASKCLTNGDVILEGTQESAIRGPGEKSQITLKLIICGNTAKSLVTAQQKLKASLPKWLNWSMINFLKFSLGSWRRTVPKNPRRARRLKFPHWVGLTSAIKLSWIGYTVFEKDTTSFNFKRSGGCIIYSQLFAGRFYSNRALQISSLYTSTIFSLYQESYEAVEGFCRLPDFYNLQLQ